MDIKWRGFSLAFHFSFTHFPYPRFSRQLAKDVLRCSFCHKQQKSVGSLISSPKDCPPQVYICDECVEVCNSILKDKANERAGTCLQRDPEVSPPSSTPSPAGKSEGSI